ncbi:small multi-drug export protein [Thermodesulfobacteriota bacterium]
MNDNNFFKRLFSLCNKVLKKLAYLIRERLNMIEVKILLIGLGLTALTGIYFIYLLFTNPSLYKVLSSTAIIHIMGGRALGIATCFSAGISLFYTILYNFFLEIVIVLIAYGVVVLVMRNVIQPKLFKNAVRQAELAAQDQKTKIKKYGSIGLFLFVMFPFFMTGPVIGAIIGYLLNYKAINNFLIVFSGTLTSIIIYALIGNNIINIINQYVHIDVMNRWSGIIIAVLIVAFLIYHLKTIKAFLYYGSDDEK